MAYDFKLTAEPLANVIVTPSTNAAMKFLSDFGPVDEQNASTFIHAAERSGFSVQHTQGDVPDGVSLIDWHDSWDGYSRITDS